jgi:hypothetical protein
MDAHVDAFVERVADGLACIRCIGDPLLRAEAAEAGFDATCGYCGRDATCVDVAWLADRVHSLVQGAFERAPTPAAPDVDGVRRIASLELVASAGRFDTALAIDVHAQLAALHRDDDGGALYGARSTYRVPDAGIALDTWAAFVAACEPRAAADAALDGRALDTLKWAFADAGALQRAKGRPVVRALAAGTRVFVAAPEGPVDASGPHGCAALEAKAAIAELRPPAASVIVVDRAKLARDVRVLDADALVKALGRTSAFTPAGWIARQRAEFVRGWRGAVRACGAEPFGAWPAAVRIATDWLAHGPSPRLDGIVTRSGYGKGRKLVLSAATLAALVPGRRRRYEVDGIRIGYRRLDRSAELARRVADADREHGDDAETGHDDDFHGSPP